MNRIALAGVLALAGCDLPLVMVEIEAPETCVTRRVEIDATAVATTPVPEKVGTPSQMGIDLSGSIGTTVDIPDNVVDLPAEAKGLLDLDVQLSAVRLTPLADDPLTVQDERTVLDGVRTVSVIVIPPSGSGLAQATILAYDRAAAGTPSGGAIVASGDMLNLAEYLYAGQLMFDYQFDVSLPAGPYAFDATVCVKTRGRAEASANDLLSL